jgi:hypothetical protein
MTLIMDTATETHAGTHRHILRQEPERSSDAHRRIQQHKMRSGQETTNISTAAPRFPSRARKCLWTTATVADS